MTNKLFVLLALFMGMIQAMDSNISLKREREEELDQIELDEEEEEEVLDQAQLDDIVKSRIKCLPHHVSEDDKAELKEYLEQGADPDLALFHAVKRTYNAALCAFFIEHGASPDSLKFLNINKKLLASLRSYEDINWDPCLRKTYEEFELFIIKLELPRLNLDYNNVDFTDNNGTFLTAAVAGARLRVVRELLMRGVEFQSATIFMAAENGDFGILRDLLFYRPVALYDKTDADESRERATIYIALFRRIGKKLRLGFDRSLWVNILPEDIKIIFARKIVRGGLIPAHVRNFVKQTFWGTIPQEVANSMSESVDYIEHKWGPFSHDVENTFEQMIKQVKSPDAIGHELKASMRKQFLSPVPHDTLDDIEKGLDENVRGIFWRLHEYHGFNQRQYQKIVNILNAVLADPRALITVLNDKIEEHFQGNDPSKAPG